MQTRNSDSQRRPVKPSSEILFVIGSLDLGGAEHHLAQVTAELAATGRFVSVYCLSLRGVQAAAVAAAGVRVIAPPIERRGVWCNRLLRPIRLLVAALGLGLYVLRNRPGVAHFFLPGAYLIGGPVALLAGVPIKLMSRRSRNHYQQRHPLARRLEAWLHRRMTAVLGNSRRVVDDLLGEGCPPAKVGLIYNGVDLSRFRVQDNRVSSRKALGIDEGAMVIAVVANLITYKGHLDLVEALASVGSELPPGWVLLCIGRDDGCRGEIARRAEERGIGHSVRFLGSRSDVPDLLALADIAVLCSHEEGFSNAVLEMMAAGRAIVATDVGGNGEAVVDGVSGLVVPARAPAQLGEAIAKLVCDPALRESFGRAAKQRAEENFSLEACVQSYRRLYEGLSAGRTLAEIGGLGASSHGPRDTGKVAEYEG